MVDVLNVQSARTPVRGRYVEAVEVGEMEAVSGQELRRFKGRGHGLPESQCRLNGREEGTCCGSGVRGRILLIPGVHGIRPDPVLCQ